MYTKDGASNESKVTKIEFDDSTKPLGTSDWKIESPPEGGVLVCGTPGSGNVIGVWMCALKHMGEKFKFQECNIMKGEQLSPDFLAINPFHEVPSGKMSDGTGLFESTAMLRYLACKFFPELYPEDKQLLIDMAMDKRQTDLYKAWGPVGYYAMQIGGAPGKDAKKNLDGVLATMAEVFLKEKYIGGAKLCIADYSILPLINTLTLSTSKKIGYAALPERWAKYLSDAKDDIGSVWETCCAQHNAWVISNEPKVETIAFEA